VWLSETELTNDETIAEFDQWVTPALERIRDTAKFRNQLGDLDRVVNALSIASANSDETDETVAAALALFLEDESATSIDDVQAVFATLSLVTAQSDNAAKCQYPIWRRRMEGNTYPQIRRRKIHWDVVPNELKQAKVASTIVALWRHDQEEALRLARSYADFLLSDPLDRRQLEVLLQAYKSAKATDVNDATLLLAPLVAFQVRGSVAASGGHGPEAIARNYLIEWGFSFPDWFNIADVVAARLADWLASNGDSRVRPNEPERTLVDDKGEKGKTRGFDFVIPNRRVNAPQRIFVQSQFYAGDSGSVSHKNVDQAETARKGASALFPNALFVELVDGAGYCSSLRKDLRHLLFARDTAGFVQLRSIPVRLRRLLQQAGIASPLEVALLAVECQGSHSELMDTLTSHVGVEQAKSSIEFAFTSGWIESSGNRELKIADDRRAVVADYQQLDSVIAAARKLSESEKSGAILVPGYGVDFGVPAGEYDNSVLNSRWVRCEVIEVLE
jgi:hypothetical protein